MSLNLVTGGSGYFGSVLVRLLREKGEKVRIFDLNKPDDCPSDIEFIQGDIRNKKVVEQAIKDVDIIYHAVAQVPIAKNKKLFWTVNVDGAENLFQSALGQRVQKVVYVSSSAVFGIPKRNPVNENVIPTPMEDYGKAKYEAEKIAERYIKKGLDITIIRPRTILGDGRLGIFSILFDWVKNGRNIPVLGSGNNRYQFVHVLDLANACYLAAKSGSTVYNIGALQFGTMRELLEGLLKHAKSSSRIISLPFGPTTVCMKLTSILGLSPLTDYHSLMYGRELFFDLTKVVKELGWRAKYSNSEMICESYDWFCAHYDEIQKRDNNRSLHTKPLKEGVLYLLKWFLR